MGASDATVGEESRLIVGFLREIGVPVRFGSVVGPTAVPGITIADGGLVVDPAGAHHPGDLLHEAGHLALLPPDRRATVSGTLPADAGAGLELGAICWSVAAAHHLGLDLAVVFHADGYRGDGAWLVETYGSGAAPGLPLLVWAGLAWAPGSEPPGEAPFPAVRRWLRAMPGEDAAETDDPDDADAEG